ncbi:MAG: peptide-methionine (S)-S-oxide reductase MsrA [bacterium]|nr:peptide-methionine (S)-S-oxide reductase MsrA [bacterium]
MKKATFAAGCFWGVEELFRSLKGVTDARVGYAGGDTEKATYEEVCSGKTGHAEAVEVTYNPEVVSYDDLLKVFWENHDPTTPNRQGPDHGTQYRSVIFFHDEEQKKRAEESKKSMAESGKFSSPIITEIVPAEIFYEAEEYHQQYFAKQGGGTCHT